MKTRPMGKARLPLAAVLAVFLWSTLPAPAQSVASLSSMRVRASSTTRVAANDPVSSDAVIIGINSVNLRSDSTTTGDVVVNAPSTGPVLDPPRDLSLEKGHVIGDLFANSVQLAKFSTTTGQIFTNTLQDDGATCNGAQPCTAAGAYAPPVFALPPFAAAVPRGADVVVNPGQTVTIPASQDVGNITIHKTGTLVLTGGVYNVASVAEGTNGPGQCAYPCRKLLFAGATDLRVAGRFNIGSRSQIGPQTGSGISASEIVIQVGGTNGGAGGPLDTPAAARTGNESVVDANFHAPNGTMHVEKQCVCTGAYIGRDVVVDQNAVVSVDSAFGNQPPVADPQVVNTNGAANVLITLTGSDPEGGDLTFAIVSGPTKGTLGAITPIVPAPIPNPNPPPANIQPPIVSATVLYTPNNPAAVEEDSFTFSVTDPGGKSASAVVTINPFDPSPAPPAPTAVDAPDILAETTTDTPVMIALSAGACAGTVVFTITSLPANGSLSNGGDIGSVPHPLPGASVLFTPGAGFNGTTSFQYSASDTTCTTTTSDTGTVTVNVSPAAELAPDQTVTSSQNAPVQVTLLANPGGTGTPISPLNVARSAAGLPIVNAPLPDATIAGNVSSTNGTTGDGKDDLPGSAPVFIAAGIDINLGTEPSGSVADGTGDSSGPDLVSATVAKSGSNLLFTVRFASGTFNSATTRAQFILDTDQNPGTGSPGVDSGCANDATIIGSDFNVEIGGTLAAAKILTATGGCNAFTTSSAGTFTVVTDGLDASVPLSSLGNDNGRLNFKVVTFTELSPTSFTGVQDYMTDIGSPVGVATVNVPQGTLRLQIEWDVTSLPSNSDEIESCQVTLTTNKGGSFDTLDTTFFAGAANQNGTLDLTDYQAAVSPTAVAVMSPSVGTDGVDVPFSFDVTGAVKTARAGGFTFFSLSGRVNESLADGNPVPLERGLQIRSSASGNQAAGTEPQLTCVTTGTPTGPQLTWRILTVPTTGLLLDPDGNQLFGSETFTLRPTLTFVSPTAGTFGFSYRVTEGSIFDEAVVTLVVQTGDDCLINGRDPGCSP